MSSDPTDVELLAFNTINDVADWAGVPGNNTDETSARKALFELLGAEPTLLPRIIGIVDEPTYVAALSTWQVSSVNVGLAVRSSGLLLGKACRIHAGTQSTIAAVTAAAAASAAHTAAASTLALAHSAPTVASRKIRLNQVINQIDDTEVTIMDDVSVLQCYARYEIIFGVGKSPAPEADVTSEQLTALRHAVISGQCPYVDLAVWGPHFMRMHKKVKLSGVIFHPDGTMHPVELMGPPCIESWLASWTVFQNACVMLDLVDLGTLIAYRDTISRYHSRYGIACWLIIYQTDVRTRLEQMPRNARRLASLHNAALVSGHTTAFTPLRPWGCAMQAAIDETNWWRAELEEPALLALTKSQALGHLIAGDAAVANMQPSRPSPQGMGLVLGPHNGFPARAPPGAPAAKKARTSASRADQVHNVDANGRYTTNRSNIAVCPAFQDGTCTHSRSCNAGVHQCNICLANDHGAKGHGKKGSGSGGKGRGGGKKGRGKGKY